MLIPKKIHYVWVGDKKKPESVLRCIASWKKYCPDYEIIEWNNEKLEEVSNLYVQQAVLYKKWAFVSDYMRLYALNECGGFYFDTDLELTNNIEKFRNYKFVIGHEIWDGTFSPLTAFMGAVKGNKIVEDLLKEYDNLEFIKNGEIDYTTNVERFIDYIDNIYGIKKPFNGEKTLELENKIFIFPYYYFCTPVHNKQNYSIHHFNGSWISDIDRKVVCQIGKYKIIRLKKKSTTVKSALPIYLNEKIISKIKTSSTRIYCIVKVE